MVTSLSTVTVRAILITYLLTYFICGNAFAYFHCTENNRSSYSDQACPASADSEEVALQFAPSTDAAAARARHEADVRQLDKLQFQRQQQDNQALRDLQRRNVQRQKQLKAEKDPELKCRRLELNARTAQRELAIITARGRERAQLKAQTAAEKVTLYCGK